ncbi:YwqG family protein [Brevibacillus sp. B_LB10_24]|uniref:YwqG family protein n=1 Tax=Brevibacillus sp. B_LB10_24 TaxID=3380645 RepID=UPI0038B6C009
MNEKEIVDLLVESGLEAYKDRIGPLIFPSFQIHLQPDDDEGIHIGASKVGGSPDLPGNVEWPAWKGFDQSFIAQINLAELPSPSLLPASGLLSFFLLYDGEDLYGDPGTCRVIYTRTEQLNGLKRRSRPADLPEEATLKPNRVSFTADLCVPASESAYLESMGLDRNGNREAYNKYWEVFLHRFHKRRRFEDYVNRLLGHPDQIQGDMQVSCEVIKEGISYETLRDPDACRPIVQSATKWRLLLQIDSEEEKTGVMWGDVGRIYFWIREDDLAEQRFDSVVCEMQCG